VLGILASGAADKFGPGNTHPGRGLGLLKKDPTTTTSAAALATTTSAPAVTTTSSGTTSPSTTAPLATTTTAVQVTSSTAAVTSTTAVVGAPAGSVVVQAGSNIQAVVDSNPAGSTFYLLAGVYLGQLVEPRNGDVFLGQPGAVLDGNGQAERAFRSGASNVTVSGFVIEDYVTPAQSGTVGGGGGSNWTISNNEIRYNGGGGVVLSDGFVVRGNYIHHNRQIGIKGGGSNVLIENNEIAFNNYLDDYSMSWEAGGTKFLKTVNLVVRGNYVHDNHGHGLWTDADNLNTLYENNVVRNNYGTGIFHEISYDAVIRYNLIEGNAFPHSSGGVKITESSNVEVYGNTLSGNDGGFHVTQSNRGAGAYGVYEIRNLFVHDNVVSFTEGWSGFQVNEGSDAFYTSMNNQFDGNDYSVGGLTTPFMWGVQVSWGQWNGFGHDLNGTVA
jgi:parallel beta-helix repeat protein